MGQLKLWSILVGDSLNLYMSFEKLIGLPNNVHFPKNYLHGMNKSVVLNMRANEFIDMPQTVGCRILLGLVC